MDENNTFYWTGQLMKATSHLSVMSDDFHQITSKFNSLLITNGGSRNAYEALAIVTIIYGLDSRWLKGEK